MPAIFYPIYMSSLIDFNELYFSPDTKRLKIVSILLIALAMVPLLLFGYLMMDPRYRVINLDSLVFVGMHIVDILLCCIVLSIIGDARLNRIPSIKKQLRYLVVLYLSVFSLILHVFLAYSLYSTLGSFYILIGMISLSKSIFALLVILFLTANVLLVLLVQIFSFRYVKALRNAHVVQETG